MCFSCRNFRALVCCFPEVCQDFKMLSPYNKFLVGISQRFLTAAESVGNTDISWSFAETALNAYSSLYFVLNEA
ncbi:hypothetical protein OESDEN_17483 [Oesophagostomum dentatum]|uniref:Uncharacterized protein n=1 Tax=Oesophagostomum dentatum TaxID=61180 RepID=A0A0B1SGZ2_OESDE|nr:hypothetical protein OESDEN_17483 [Oesophagostomum dentatum]